MTKLATLADSTYSHISEAIAEQALPTHFQHTVTDYYWPLAQALKQRISHNQATHMFIGIQGSQGSGKSTCASFIKLLLEAEFGLRVLVASIDDFYLSKVERDSLAHSVHPLFATRGVPGTHDVAMMHAVFDSVVKGDAFSVPVFNKADDDRAPREQWQTIDHAVDVVILEGWCVGIGPQNEKALGKAVNSLEANEDAEQRWRNEVNRALAEEYRDLFSRLDVLVALQAPSFDCVLGWRQLQERKMIDKLEAQGQSTQMTLNPTQIERFIAHYQRLTEHALQSLPARADFLLRLDEHHQFVKFEILA